MVPEEIDLGEIVLRRWRQADAEVLAAAVAASAEHLRPWMPWTDRMSLDESRAVLARWDSEWRAGDNLNWGLFVDSAVAGSCGILRRVGPGGYEIGYWVHAAHTRHGYATSATVALTSLAFTLPGVTFVEIHHDRANVASGAIPRKLGFEPVGEARIAPRAPGESGTHVVWRMDREQWRPRAKVNGPPL